MALRLAIPEDEAPSGVIQDALDDLPWRDVRRLQALFPGVDPRVAATALILAALDEAETINGGDHG